MTILCEGIKMKQVNTNQVSALSQVAKSLANTKPVKDSVFLSDNSKALWVDYAKDYKGSENTKALLVDSLFADGIKSYHIVGASDEDKSLVQLRHQIIQLIISADKDDMKLYNAEPKTLSLTMQATQSILKTKTIPTIIGNIKKALASREANKDKEGKAKPKTKEQMAKQSLQAFIKYAKESKNGYEGITKDIAMAESFSVLKQVK
jgi:hypothetical protein